MNSDRFAALACLPSDGLGAARELCRCVVKLGFCGGVVVLNREEGWGVSGMEELWNTAMKLKVPILIREGWVRGSEV
jgi:predicted TIM-barrel fold metal-dependent hydrolase